MDTLKLSNTVKHMAMQIYVAVEETRTDVDRTVESMRRARQVRLFKLPALGANQFALMFMRDYEEAIMAMRAIESNPQHLAMLKNFEGLVNELQDLSVHKSTFVKMIRRPEVCTS